MWRPRSDQDRAEGSNHGVPNVILRPPYSPPDSTMRHKAVIFCKNKTPNNQNCQLPSYSAGLNAFKQTSQFELTQYSSALATNQPQPYAGGQISTAFLG